MLSKFLNFINEKKLVGKNQKILVAVSGGIDSMVMADLFIKSGMNIGIAHCNFCLRGKESDKDEVLVKRLAAGKGIPFHSIRFDTKKYAGENHISIQMAARDLRYSWFGEIRKKDGYNRIAVAHNLNDNIETMLINLSRGTGIAGLTGMKPSANNIIRPLLFATRQEIESYCRKYRIIYREDQSNAEIKYSRNKIRHLVMPVLKEINPSVETTLNETAARLSEVNDIMDLFIRKLTGEIIRNEDNILKISIKTLKEFEGNNTIIYEIFRPFGISGKNLDDINSVIRGKTGSRVLTGSHRIIRNRNDILIVENLVSRTDSTSNDLDELKQSGIFRSVKTSEITTSFSIPESKKTACIDFRKLKFPVTVRHWHPGDLFFPLGMKHRKKLSDYLIDRKFSIPEKEKLLILESDGKIAWLIGERIDERFKVTKRTREVIIFEL